MNSFTYFAWSSSAWVFTSDIFLARSSSNLGARVVTAIDDLHSGELSARRDLLDVPESACLANPPVLPFVLNESLLQIVHDGH